MRIQAILMLMVSIILVCKCEHLIIGDSSNKGHIAAHHITALYKAIPYKRRIENVFYSNPEQRKIKSILAYDNMHSDAVARVTAGGVGYTFVNIRLKSERGQRLDYDIEICA